MSAASRPLVPTQRWQRKRSLKAPSTLEAICDSGRSNVKMSGERIEASGNPTNREAHGQCPVSLLHFSRGPSAVARFVVAVVVDSVKRFASRTLSHVLNKIFERVHPSFAHLDSTTAPSPIILVGCSRASRFHARPRSKSASFAFPMGGIENAIVVPAKTPAGLCESLRQTAVANDTLLAAIAPAHRISQNNPLPIRSRVSRRWSISDNNQSFKAASDEGLCEAGHTLRQYQICQRRQR